MQPQEDHTLTDVQPGVFLSVQLNYFLDISNGFAPGLEALGLD